MKILVTGSQGQLGYDVIKRGISLGYEMVGIDREQLDLTDKLAVQDYFTQNHFDAFIHCAAYTAVDLAEDNENLTYDINVNATKYLIESARKQHAKFIYISTDYVYDGEGTCPFTEEDTPNPIGVYAKTKYEGEQIVQTYNQSFIVRISWVFGINGNNFIKTMLKLAETKNELSIVADQVGSPTYTKDLAILLLDMINTDKFGIYQASNEGFCSWYDFAKYIFETAGISIDVIPVTSEAFPTKARRPKNSRMSKEKLTTQGFERLPHWQDAVERYIIELKENQDI